jgi:hypothetical protein
LFQVNVIDFHRPALLIVSQGLLHRQGKIGADEVIGEMVPGRFFERIAWTGSAKPSRCPWTRRCSRWGFVLFGHSLERDPLIRLVPERQVVLVNTHFVNTPVRLDGTDDLPLLPPTEFDQFLGSIPGVKENETLCPLGRSVSNSTNISRARQLCCGNGDVWQRFASD